MKNQKKKLTKTAEALTCFDFFVREKRKQMNISKFDNFILLLLHSFFFCSFGWETERKWSVHCSWKVSIH